MVFINESNSYRTKSFTSNKRSSEEILLNNANKKKYDRIKGKKHKNVESWEYVMIEL